MNERRRLGIGELARKGGVSRRAVRYYVQQGLLPPPEGLGRGAFYRPEHLERLTTIRRLQEDGLRLDAIRRHLEGDDAPAARTSPPAAEPTVWTRVPVADGVELQVRAGALPPDRVDQLAALLTKTLSTDDDQEGP